MTTNMMSVVFEMDTWWEMGSIIRDSALCFNEFARSSYWRFKWDRLIDMEMNIIGKHIERKSKHVKMN